MLNWSVTLISLLFADGIQGFYVVSGAYFNPFYKYAKDYVGRNDFKGGK